MDVDKGANLKPGQYKIIRVDGTETIVDKRPTIAVIADWIGCESLDFVRIGKNPANGPRQTTMAVDDIGAGFEGSAPKPINPKATALYWSICVPGTVECIHGDVVIFNDEDFA